MEAIKNTLGLGSSTTTNTQEGREPVSGVSGNSSAGEPFDAGNVDTETLGGKAPQHTGPGSAYTNPDVPSTGATTDGLRDNHTNVGRTSIQGGVDPTAASATSSSTPADGPYTIGSGISGNNTSSTTSGTTGLGSSSTTAGPHGSDLANKTDPRVDSDRDGHTVPGAGLASSTGAGSSSTTTGSSLPGKSTGALADSSSTSTAPAEQSGKTGGIGSSSWFGTAVPGGQSKSTEGSGSTSGPPSAASVAAATTSAEPHSQSSTTKSGSLEDIRSQPPNNLPSNVPAGGSTDFARSSGSTSTPSTTTGAASTLSPTSHTNDPMHATQEIPDRSTSLQTGSSSIGGTATDAPSHSLAGSRGSIAPPVPDHSNAPLKPAEKGGEHGINPSAVPTAGGKKIGEDAYTERKSMQADATDSSIAPPATGMGSTTSANTSANTGTTGTTTTTPATISGSSAGTEKDTVTSSGGDKEHKEKKGLVEKIKEKVHHKH